RKDHSTKPCERKYLRKACSGTFHHPCRDQPVGAVDRAAALGQTRVDAALAEVGGEPRDAEGDARVVDVLTVDAEREQASALACGDPGTEVRERDGALLRDEFAAVVVVGGLELEERGRRELWMGEERRDDPVDVRDAAAGRQGRSLGGRGRSRL